MLAAVRTSVAPEGAMAAVVLGGIAPRAEAVHEGHVAARRYQELRARGVAHDKTAERVFAELYRAG